MGFTSAFDQFNKPDRISVLLGRCCSSAQLIQVKSALTYVDQNGIRGQDGLTWAVVQQMRDAVRLTQTIDALNRGRKGVRVRLAERLAPMLEAEIAVAVVPSHDPWLAETPIRLLAQALAADNSRTDATACLLRHTKIQRIVYGGHSSPYLHRTTIRLEHPELVQGKRVLLLDDIAKSGQSLLACRIMLYDAGATVVQAACLGRVIGGVFGDTAETRP